MFNSEIWAIWFSFFFHVRETAPVPPSSPPGEPGAGRGQRGEEEGRPPPGQAQVPQHAGAQEEVPPGPLLQGQVGLRSLIHADPRGSRGKTWRAKHGTDSNDNERTGLRDNGPDFFFLVFFWKWTVPIWFSDVGRTFLPRQLNTPCLKLWRLWLKRWPRKDVTFKGS